MIMRLIFPHSDLDLQSWLYPLDACDFLKLLNSSVPQFPHLQNGDTNGASWEYCLDKRMSVYRLSS